MTALVTSDVTPSGIPTEHAFTEAFAISAGGALPALAAAMAIRALLRRARARRPRARA